MLGDVCGRVVGREGEVFRLPAHQDEAEVHLGQRGGGERITVNHHKTTEKEPRKKFYSIPASVVGEESCRFPANLDGSEVTFVGLWRHRHSKPN